MNHKVKILMTEFITHNVKSFIVEKPDGYKYDPGQVTLVSVNESGWENKKRPFTFASLESDEVIQFIIKGYFERDGVTKKIHSLKVGDELILEEPWGVMEYKGKGVFIAGGAGITPFIAIFRSLCCNGKIAGNKMFLSNKSRDDIILESELRFFLQDDVLFTLTQKDAVGYESGRIDMEFLKKHITDFSQHFYICGPPKMIIDLRNALKELGADTQAIVFEK